MATPIFLLSYLAHDETPTGMDFLTNSAPFLSREAAEKEAQNIHDSLNDLEDYKEGPLLWAFRKSECHTFVSAAWLADDDTHMFLIRKFEV